MLNRSLCAQYQAALAVPLLIVALLSGGLAAQEPPVEDQTAALFKAVRAGERDAVLALLDWNPRLTKALDEDGLTPLQAAVQASYAAGASEESLAQVVQALLERGADPRVVDTWGRTLLHGMASKRMAEQLLAAGALVDAADRNGATPLISAVNLGQVGVAEALVAHGAALDQRDSEGWSAIERAVQVGAVPMVAWLASRGAAGGALLAAVQANEPAAVDAALASGVELAPSCKSVALLDAARSRRSGLAKAMLRSGADPNVSDGLWKSPLYFAVEANDLDLARMLLENGSKPHLSSDGLLAFHDNPLRAAVLGKNAAMVELLLSHGALTFDLERLVMDGLPGPTLLESAVWSGELAVVKALLDHGVPPDSRDGSMSDPLAAAAANGRLDLAELLLEHGADPSASEAVDKAVERGDSKLVEFLLARGVGKPGAPLVGTGPLQSAVRTRDRAQLDLLLARGFSLEQHNDAGLRALEVAAELGDLELLKHLIDRGSEVDPTDGYLPGALHIAAARGDLAMSEFLLARGASLERFDLAGDTALDAAVLAGQTQIAALLLSRGARVRKPGDEHAGTLGRAAESGKAEVIDLLLAHGGDLSQRDAFGRTVLDGVLDQGQAEVSQLLVARGAVAGVPHPEPLIEAVQRGDLALVRALLPGDPTPNEARGEGGASLLHLAARGSHVDVARLLIASGVDLEAQDFGESTPLHFAAHAGAPVTEVLLSAGAAVDAVNYWGDTPLFWSKDAATARAFTERGAQIEFLDSYGRTPLMRMALDGRVDAMRELVARGARLDFEDLDGATALDVAAREGVEASVRLLAELRARGSELVLATWLGDLAGVDAALANAAACPEAVKASAVLLAVKRGRKDVVARLLAAGAKVGARDLRGRSPLLYSVAENDVELIEILMTHGADATLQDVDGDSPMRLATRLERREALEALLKHGADIDVLILNEESNGFVTPLLEAIERGSAGFVAYLLERGAKANGTDSKTGSPLRHAVWNSQTRAVELLFAHGASLPTEEPKGLGLLDLAVARDDVEIARMLLERGAPPNLRDSEGKRPLDRAEDAGAAAMSAVLRAHGAISERRIAELFEAIARAVDVSDAEQVGAMLDAAPELLNTVHDGKTPLVAALRDSNFLTFAAVVRRKPNPNVFDKDGFSPLFRTIGNRLWTALVLSLEPDLNVRNGPQRMTALMAAAQVKGEDGLAIARILIDRGAQVNAKDSLGATPLHYATTLGEAAMVRLLCEKGAALDARMNEGETAVWVAVNEGRLDTLGVLIEAGANVNLIGGKQKLAPILIATTSDRPDVVRALLRAKADPHAATSDGLRSVHVAAGSGDITILQLLLDAGAAVNAKTVSGKTAIDFASIDIDSWLRARGGLSGAELP